MIGELKEVKCCLKGKGEIPGPLYWLQHHTETFDEKWKEKSLPSPYRKFPDPFGRGPPPSQCLMGDRQSPLNPSYLISNIQSAWLKGSDRRTRGMDLIAGENGTEPAYGREAIETDDDLFSRCPPQRSAKGKMR
jgi:hypothetical protein